MPSLLLLSSDLLLASQIEAPARATGLTVAVASTIEALAATPAGDRPEVVVLDLADRAFPFDETYRRIRDTSPAARILAFYPHVQDQLGKAAQAAGCDLVLPRSRFLTRPADTLRQLLDSGALR